MGEDSVAFEVRIPSELTTGVAGVAATVCLRIPPGGGEGRFARSTGEMALVLGMVVVGVDLGRRRAGLEGREVLLPGVQ